MKSNSETKLPYFVIAIGIGAIAVLLSTPRSGEETWEYLRGRSRNGLDNLKQQARKLRESAAGVMEKGKGFMDRRDRESLKAAAEAENQAYQEEKREHSGG